MPIIDYRSNTHQLAIKCAFADNAIIRTLRSRRWDPGIKAWIMPAGAVELRDLANAFPGRIALTPAARILVRQIREEYDRRTAARSMEDAELIAPWSNRLRPFQRVGVSFLVSAKRAILADDRGLGKTVQALTALYETNAFPALIVCQATCRLTPWRDEIRKWMGEDYSIAVIGGSNQNRQDRLALFAQNADITVINYESTRIHEEELQARTWGTLIVDESHLMKNPDALQTKRILGVARRCEHVYLVTGTPILNRAQEIWTSLMAIDPRTFDPESGYWSFIRRHFEIVPDRFGVKIGGLLNPVAFRKFMEPYFLRREKWEVTPEMPSKTVQRVMVEMDSRQREMYREMAAEWLVTLADGGIITVPIILAKMTRLRQIAVSPRLLDRDAPVGPKIEAVLDLLDSTEDKVVIFSQFKTALDLVEEGLEPGTYVRIDGDVPMDDRPDLINRFQTDPDCRAFLGTIQASGLGITLHAAATAIFMDKAWSPGVNDQAQDRLHRIGQTRPVTILEISAENSIDDWMEELLADKREIFDAVFGNQRPAETGITFSMRDWLTQWLARWNVNS